jgi:hypothetical protein
MAGFLSGFGRWYAGQSWIIKVGLPVIAIGLAALGVKYFGGPALDRLLHGTPATVGGYNQLTARVTIIRVTRPGVQFPLSPNLEITRDNVTKASKFWEQYGIKIKIERAVEEMREEYYRPTIGREGEGTLNDAINEFSAKYPNTVIIMTVGGWTGEGEEAVNGATARSRKGYAVSGFGVTTHAHEFGHVIWGLSHVDGVRNNIMNGSISDNVNDVMEAFASQRQVDAARRYLIGQDYVE